MLFTYSNNVLTIDNNDHYFRGYVDKSSFPEIIKGEYEEIIEKSFNNYSNNEMSIENEFIKLTFHIILNQYFLKHPL